MPLSVSDGVEAWIDDFAKSDAPQFKGKSKEKRKQMALAAFYSKKRGESVESADPLDRFRDLQRQGFMKPRRVKKAKVQKPIVACDGCMDWHREGEHTKSAAERRANLAKYPPSKKKEGMALLQSAQLLLELDNMPNQDKRSLNNPDNPYTSNRTTPPSSRYVTGGTSTSVGTSSPAMSTQPSMDTGGGLNPTTTAVPSSTSSRTGDLLGAQGNLATPATDINTTSTYGSSVPKELDDLSKTKIAKADSLLLISPRQLLELEDITCPYCGATGTDPFMHQHHFSKCKYKPGN